MRDTARGGRAAASGGDRKGDIQVPGQTDEQQQALAPRPAPAASAGGDVLQGLAALVVKDGVALGGLPAAQRELALALVWRGLPAATVLNEPGVNALLKSQLAGAAAFLGTDHVELRRWLVDAGWLARDGYGREYRACAAEALAAERRRLAVALAVIEPASWVVATRAEQRARREARRRAWQAEQAAPNGSTAQDGQA